MRSRKHSGSEPRKRSGLTSYLGAARERVGTAGFILAIIALVVALSGGAFAIAKGGGGLTAKEKKEVKSIAKGLVQPGPPGAQGPAGPPGKDGAQGPAGPPGQNGKSVTVTEIPTEEEACEELGGAEVEQEDSGSAVEVCNGAPWTAGGILPSGATETGTYSPLEPGELFPETFIPGILANNAQYLLPISFPIPRAGGAELIFVPTVPAGEGQTAYGTATGCPGVTNEVPKANSGKLCVYASPSGLPGEPDAVVSNGNAVGPVGTMLQVKCSGAEGAFKFCGAFGVWAVTG